jgi:hypothetical protein
MASDITLKIRIKRRFYPTVFGCRLITLCDLPFIDWLDVIGDPMRWPVIVDFLYLLWTIITIDYDFEKVS